MANRVAQDPRIDPRIKAVFGVADLMAPGDDASRDAMLAQEHSDEGNARAAMAEVMLNSMDREEIAPSAGLTVTEHEFVSAPDGNTVRIRFIRPEGSETLPCVYYHHRGAMLTLSCYYGNHLAS